MRVLIALALVLVLSAPRTTHAKLTFLTKPSAVATLRSSSVGLPSGAFTVEFWYRVRGTPSSSGFVFNICDAGAYTNAALFGTIPDATPHRCHFEMAGIVYTGYGCPNDGRWTHAALVFGGPAMDASLYINFELIYTTTTVANNLAPTDWITFGNDVDSGCIINDPNQAFVGAVAEFRIWDSALDVAAIRAAAAGPVPVPSPGLATYFRFDPADISGSTYSQAPGMPGSAVTSSTYPPIASPSSVPFTSEFVPLPCQAHSVSPIPHPVVTPSLPNIIHSTRAADLDMDGALDLVFSQWKGAPSSYSTVAYALSNGTYSFSDPVTVSTDYHVAKADAADLTGNGRADILYLGSSGHLYVQLASDSPAPLSYALAPYNSATGRASTFAPHNAYYAIAQDLTNDGLPDVVLASSSSIYVVSFTPTTATATLAAARSSIRLPKFTRALSLIDFNGDGYADIPFLDLSGTLPAVYMLVRNPGSPADFNDGSPTLIASDYDELAIVSNTSFVVSASLSDTSVVLWDCPGDSTCAPVAEIETSAVWNEVHLADIDGNGLGDLLLCGRSATRAELALQYSPGRFYATAAPVPGAPGTERCNVDDMNGDGLKDIVFGATDAGSTQPTGDIWIWTSGPAPAYAVADIATAASPCAGSLKILSVDANHDGLVDVPVVCLATGAVSRDLLATSGVGALMFDTSGATPPPPLGPLLDAAFVDLDSNGILDIVGLSTTGDVVWRADPFYAPTSAPTPSFAGAASASSMLCADVNGDGDVDVVLASASSGLVLLLNAGVGASDSAPLLGSPTTLFSAASITGVAHMATSGDALAWSDAAPNRMSWVPIGLSFSASLTPSHVSLPGSPVALAFGTLNGTTPTQKSLLVLTAGGQLVSVMLSGGSPTPESLVTLRTAPAATGMSMMVTLDAATGYPSIAIVSQTASPFLQFAVQHDHGWTAASSKLEPSMVSPRAVALGHVTGSALLDAVIDDGTSLTVYKALGGPGTPVTHSFADFELLPECGGVVGSLVCISAKLLRRTTATCAPTLPPLLLPPVPPSGSHCVRSHSPTAHGYHTLVRDVSLSSGTLDCGAVGGVLWSFDGSATVSVVDVTFVSSNPNPAYTAVYSGGALVVGNGAALGLTNVVVAGFVAPGGRHTNSGYGGGILVSPFGSLILTDVQFHGCEAAEFGGAVAALVSSTVSLNNVTFRGNTVRNDASNAVSGGGALGLSTPASVGLTTLVFDSNTAAGASARGGALYLSLDSSLSVTVSNAQFVNNTAPGGYGGAAFFSLPLGATIGFSTSTFSGSSALFGGTFATTAVNELPATFPLGESVPNVLPPIATSELSVSSGRVTLDATSSLGTTHGRYGGLLFACGAVLDISLGNVGGMVSSADIAGGVYFTCPPLVPGLSPLIITLPAPSGSLLSPAGYGVYEASPVTRIAALSTISSVVAGFDLGSGVAFTAQDEFGSSVADPNVFLTVESVPEFVRDNALAGIEFDSGLGHYTAARVSFEVAPGFWPQHLNDPFEVKVSAPVVGSDANLATVTFMLELDVCPVGAGAISGPSGWFSCSLCAAGTESLVKSTAQCTLIPNCILPALPINGTCQECPPNTVRAVVASGIPPCVCSQGFWNVNNEPDTACLPCPSGASCDGGTGPSAAPYARVGYARVSGAQFAECPIEGACLGSDVCADAYAQDSLLCKDCAEGAYRDRKGECTRCPGQASSLMGLLIVLIVLAAVAAAAIGIMAVIQFQSRREGIDSALSSRVPHTVSLAIIFLQVLGILSQAPLRWPEPPVRDILEAANVANVDLSLFAVDCSLESFALRYSLSVFVPILFGLFMILILVLIKFSPCCTCLCLGRLDRQAMVLSDVLVWGVFTAGPLLFIPLSRTSLVYFDCTLYPNGKLYLDSEPSLECFGEEWWATLPVALLGLTLYVIMLPTLFAVVLYSKRNRLDEPLVLLRYGTVYSPFRRYYFWAGLVDMAKRLGLVVVSVFASNIQVFLFAGVIAVFLGSMMFISRTEPYLYHSLNLIEIKLDLSIVILVVCGMLFWINDWNTEAAYIVCIVFAVGAIAFAALVLIMGFIHELRHQAASRRKVGSQHTLDPRGEIMVRIIRQHARDLDTEAWPVILDTAFGSDSVAVGPGSLATATELVGLSGSSSHFDDGSDRPSAIYGDLSTISSSGKDLDALMSSSPSSSSLDLSRRSSQRRPTAPRSRARPSNTNDMDLGASTPVIRRGRRNSRRS